MMARLCLLALVIAAAFPGGSEAVAKERSAKDKALLEKAIKECNGPHYPSGARMQINYPKGTFRCIEPTGGNRR